MLGRFLKVCARLHYYILSDFYGSFPVFREILSAFLLSSRPQRPLHVWFYTFVIWSYPWSTKRTKNWILRNWSMSSQQISSKFHKFLGFKITNCSVPFVFHRTECTQWGYCRPWELACIADVHQSHATFCVTQTALQESKGVLTLKLYSWRNICEVDCIMTRLFLCGQLYST